jgi:hypothetical protein
LESSFPAWFRWIRRWRLFHGLALAVLATVTVIYASLGVPVRSVTFLVGYFAAFLLWAIPAGQLALIECPRCHQRFFWLFGRFMIIAFFFQSRCARCRLPEYADDTHAKTKT